MPSETPPPVERIADVVGAALGRGPCSGPAARSPRACVLTTTVRRFLLGPLGEQRDLGRHRAERAGRSPARRPARSGGLSSARRPRRSAPERSPALSQCRRQRQRGRPGAAIASTIPAMAMTISTATAAMTAVREALRGGGVLRSSMGCYRFPRRPILVGDERLTPAPAAARATRRDYSRTPSTPGASTATSGSSATPR